MKFAVVVSRFNADISEALLDGAWQGFTDHDVPEKNVTIVHVPGAFEIPLMALTLAQRGDCAAVIALGAVIRGDTAHFEYVAGECARGLQQAALETGVPRLFGVLTTETREQAQERSAPDRSNKGWECVSAAISMAASLAAVRSPKA